MFKGRRGSNMAETELTKKITAGDSETMGAQ